MVGCPAYRDWVLQSRLWLSFEELSSQGLPEVLLEGGYQTPQVVAELGSWQTATVHNTQALFPRPSYSRPGYVWTGDRVCGPPEQASL